jgi:hypothetical protein
MSDGGSGGDFAVPRDAGGRYVPGGSGNPAGKPRGCLNRATRLAAALLDGEAEALLRTEIDLAKAGDRMLLRHCTDKLLGPRRGQPVEFAMPPVATAGDIAAAVGAVLRGAARRFARSDHAGRGGNASARRCCRGAGGGAGRTD